MRILHVVDSLDPDQGGPPTVVLRIAASHATLGDDVSVLSASSPVSKDDVRRSIEAVPGSDRVTFHEAPMTSVADLLFTRQAARLVANVLKDIDFVHIHGLWRPLLLQTIRAARQRKIPYAVTPHVMLSPWSLQRKRIKKKLALWLVWRSALSEAAFIHALNTAEKRGVEQLRLSTPIVVVPNGVFPEEFSELPAKGSFFATHPELNGQPYIIFLSRLHYQKGVDHLINGFALFAKSNPEIRLVMVGPDYGDLDLADSLITKHSLNDRIHLVGAIYGEEKLAALVDAQFFCLPSRQEGFSMAILEAMACGLPVVLSEQCNFPEVAGERAGLVVELTAETLAQAFQQLIDNTRLRAEMGAAARNMVLSRYTWPVIARQLSEHCSASALVGQIRVFE